MADLNSVAKNVFVIPNFQTVEFCETLLVRIDEMQFEPASLNGQKSKMRIRKVRNNDRIIWDNPELAGQLWEKLKSVELPHFFGARPVSLNERLRIYRYEKGQKFDWHADARFARKNGEQSLYTFLLYLTEGFEGGETSFVDAKIVAETGMACIFEHKIRHKGCEVISGSKIVLRSDIMYTPLSKALSLHG